MDFRGLDLLLPLRAARLRDLRRRDRPRRRWPCLLVELLSELESESLVVEVSSQLPEFEPPVVEDVSSESESLSLDDRL